MGELGEVVVAVLELPLVRLTQCCHLQCAAFRLGVRQRQACLHNGPFVPWNSLVPHRRQGVCRVGQCFVDERPSPEVLVKEALGQREELLLEQDREYRHFSTVLRT